MKVIRSPVYDCKTDINSVANSKTIYLESLSGYEKAF